VLPCVAVCCRVLQCVAVCCSVLPCVAVCCCVLQCLAEHYSVFAPSDHVQRVLQCVAVCCRVLQCVAACCSVLQRVAVYCSVLQSTTRCLVPSDHVPSRVASYCSVLHRVAMSCDVLQYAVVCCNCYWVHVLSDCVRRVIQFVAVYCTCVLHCSQYTLHRHIFQCAALPHFSCIYIIAHIWITCHCTHMNCSRHACMRPMHISSFSSVLHCLIFRGWSMFIPDMTHLSVWHETFVCVT